ncbi:MAG: FAD binding domain-containing protein [Acidobacteriota bacterium]|nr:FAD binding domain-containing protein [Acidobacteriota bacterium]
MSVVVPTSVAAALEVLAAQPDAQVLAGGTDFMVELNDGRRRPEVVVALRAVEELCQVSIDGDHIRIGAGVTYRDMMGPDLASVLPALAQAARTVGSPPIRNAGTLGGNLVTASPAGDTLPVLAALDAQVEIVSLAGRRKVPLSEFLVGPKRHDLRPGELVEAVVVERPRGGQEYLKIGVRNAMVIAVASLAMTVDTTGRRIRVAMGSVAPTPRRAALAEDWLNHAVDWSGGSSGPVWRDSRPAAVDATLEQLAEMVGRDAAPIDDHRSSARYRTHAVGVLAARAARRLIPDSPPPAGSGPLRPPGRGGDRDAPGEQGGPR